MLAERLTGARPALWGVAEPLTREWSPSAITAMARKRAPGQSVLVFAGPPGGKDSRPFAGSLRVSRTPSGVREHLLLTVGHRPGEGPALDALEPRVRAFAEGDGLRRLPARRAP